MVLKRLLTLMYFFLLLLGTTGKIVQNWDSLKFAIILRNLSETGLSTILTACNESSSLIFSEMIWRIASLLRGSLDKLMPAVFMTNSESSVIRRLCSPFS